MELVMNKKAIKGMLLAVLVLGILLLLCNMGYANEGGDLPWNTGLDKLVKALSGKTAVFITAIGLFVLAGMAIFGGDLGVVGKGLMMVIIAGSILTGLIKVTDHFFKGGFSI